jgi:hypothetical protein
MAFVITSPEWLEIDGIPLSTPAWETADMSDLLSSPEVRGDDILVPYGDGVRPYPRRPTVTPASIELQIVGDTAPDGTATANPREGLQVNCAILATLADRPAVADGTRLATLHLVGAVRSARVHVLRIRFARTGPNYATGQLELSIPSGALR